MGELEGCGADIFTS